jgi:hypothetical protein
MKLLATAGDGEPVDGGLKENSDTISTPQNNEIDRSHSLHTTPAPPATAPQVIAAIDDQSATLVRRALIPESNNPETPQPVAEAEDDKQEWEISDIVGKEVVDGQVHYLVEWSATLVPKCELGKAKVLVDKFEARLLAQCKQRAGKRQVRLPQSKPSRQVVVGTHDAAETTRSTSESSVKPAMDKRCQGIG